MAGPPDSPLAPPFACARCGDVIGVYEPLIALTDGGARETSRAAEPQISPAAGRQFHRACYIADFGATPIINSKPR